MLKHLPRPIVVHFIQTLASPETDESREAKAKRRHTWKGDTDRGDRSERPLPSFSGDHMTKDQLETLTAVVRSASPPPASGRNLSGGQTPQLQGGYVSFT
jgi:hypothetical protein